MFRGSMAAKIDDKGRLKVPQTFRRVLEESWGADVFTTSVLGESALIYPLPVWEGVEARLAELPATDRVKQRYLARVSYYGQQGRLDAQGRVVLPPILRQAADIDGEVVVCGALDHLEVWSHQSFVNRLQEEPFTEQDFLALSERGI